MKKPGLRGGFWPTDLDESLLRVAFADGPVAARMWEDLRRRHRTEVLVETADRLAPLLYRLLSAAGVEGPAVPLLEKAYRSAVASGTSHLEGLALMLRTLERERIDALVLSGAAMVLVHYHDPGLRPMGDIDVLIRRESLRGALPVLRDVGWSAAFDPPRGFEGYQQRLRLRARAGQVCDLRWLADGGLIDDAAPDATDDPFWDSAQPAVVNDVSTKVFCATDRLLFILVNGTSPHHGGARTQWVSDALQVLRDERIDWTRLRDQAERLRVVHTVRDALTYLDRWFDAPVREAMFLRGRKESRLVHWMIDRRTTTYQGSFLHSYRAYVRRNRPRGIMRTALGSASYIQTKWGLESRRGLFTAAARRVLRTLRPTPTRPPGADSWRGPG